MRKTSRFVSLVVGVLMVPSLVLANPTGVRGSTYAVRAGGTVSLLRSPRGVDHTRIFRGSAQQRGMVRRLEHERTRVAASQVEHGELSTAVARAVGTAPANIRSYVGNTQQIVGVRGNELNAASAVANARANGSGTGAVFNRTAGGEGRVIAQRMVHSIPGRTALEVADHVVASTQAHYEQSAQVLREATAEHEAFPSPNHGAAVERAAVSVDQAARQHFMAQDVAGHVRHELNRQHR